MVKLKDHKEDREKFFVNKNIDNECTLSMERIGLQGEEERPRKLKFVRSPWKGVWNSRREERPEFHGTVTPLGMTQPRSSWMRPARRRSAGGKMEIEMQNRFQIKSARLPCRLQSLETSQIWIAQRFYPTDKNIFHFYDKNRQIFNGNFDQFEDQGFFKNLFKKIVEVRNLWEKVYTKRKILSLFKSSS